MVEPITVSVAKKVTEFQTGRKEYYRTGTLSERDKGWVEGIIDGEGCLSFSAPRDPSQRRGFKFMPALSVSATSFEMLDRFTALCGGTFCVGKRQTVAHKTIYRLQLHSNALRWLLPQLKLTVKENQRILMLKGLSLLALNTMGRRPNYLRSYFDGIDLQILAIGKQISALNKRGPIAND